MAAKKKSKTVLNFQAGTTGRKAKTVTYSFREAHPRKGRDDEGNRKPRKSLTAQVRCEPGVNTKVCAIAEAASDKAVYAIRQAELEDSERKAAAKRKAKKRTK